MPIGLVITISMVIGACFGAVLMGVFIACSDEQEEDYDG